MKRLNESREYLGEGERLLADLVEAHPRTQSDPFRKRRIRAKLQAGLRPKSGTLHFGGRTVMVVGLLCVATAAAAMIGGVKLASRSPSSRPDAVSSSDASRLPVSPVRRLRSSSTPADATRVDVATTPSNGTASSNGTAATPPNELAATVGLPNDPTAKEATTKEATTKEATAGARSVSPTTSELAAPAGEDPSLVASAIRALRNENDPARARALLARYLKSNPRGVLAEEALALSIEAAAKMHDPQAKSLARAYLKAYPKGGHRTLAENVSAR